MNAQHTSIASTQEIIEDIRAGRMVVLVDAEDRENEGDLIIPAQFATPAAVNFMARYGRGLICLCLTRDRARTLQLDMMARENRESMKTAFTVSIEAKEGVTTGISAHDRALTVRTAVNPQSRAEADAEAAAASGPDASPSASPAEALAAGALALDPAPALGPGSPGRVWETFLFAWMTEKMGFTGRGEGLAAQAIVAVETPA